MATASELLKGCGGIEPSTGSAGRERCTRTSLGIRSSSLAIAGAVRRPWAFTTPVRPSAVDNPCSPTPLPLWLAPGARADVYGHGIHAKGLSPADRRGLRPPIQPSGQRSGHYEILRDEVKLAEGQRPGHPTSTLSGFPTPFCVPLSLTTYTRRRRPAAIPLHRASAAKGDKRVLAKRASFRA